MISILISIWQRKLNITKEKTLFTLFIAISYIFGIILTSIAIIAMLKTNNIILLMIANALIFQYNKPLILAEIVNKRNVSFYCDRRILLRFILFHLFKANVFLFIGIVSNILVLPYAFMSGNIIYLFCTWLVIIDIYLLEIFNKCKKIILFLLCVGLIATSILQIPLLGFVIVILNIGFLFNTLHKQLLEQFYQKSYENVMLNKYTYMSISFVNRMFFIRMPIKEVIEVLFSGIVFYLLGNFAGIPVAIYAMVIFFLVELELEEDIKIKNVELHYGKRTFLQFSHISKCKLFMLSVEFRMLLKSIVYNVLLVILSIQKSGVSVKNLVLILICGILLTGLSLRFHKVYDLVVMQHGILRTTWFRMVIIYYILFCLLPFLCLETLQKIDWYHEIYGLCFSLFMAIGLICVPLEKCFGILKKFGEEDVE